MISKLIEVLRYLERYERDTGDTSHYAQWFKSAADTIEELSAKLSASQMERLSQYYHGGWIPCDEWMPEKDGYYLVTTRGKDVFTGDTVTKVRILWFVERLKVFECAPEVLAWQPLPEPYREVRDETD